MATVMRRLAASCYILEGIIQRRKMPTFIHTVVKEQNQDLSILFLFSRLFSLSTLFLCIFSAIFS